MSVYNENTTFADTDARLYGAITYLFEDTIEKDDYAYPFDKNNFTFPKKGETVIILKMFGRNQQTFYLPYTNTVYPNYRRDYITYERGVKKELESAGKDTSASNLTSTANSGGKTQTNKVDKENKVDVNEKIKFLKPKDGDTIISGRAGTGTARIRKVNTCLICRLKNVLIFGALNSLFGSIGGTESNIKSHKSCSDYE